MRKLLPLLFIVLIILALPVCSLAGNPGVHSGAFVQQEVPAPPTPPPPPPPPPKHVAAPPKLLHQVEPAYPPEAKAKHLEGIVLLKVTIDKTGAPENIVVEKGNPELTPSAIEAVNQWRWEPYRLKGRPVSIVTSITVNYKLKKEKAPVKE